MLKKFGCADAQWLLQFCIYILSFFKFYIMYHLFCYTASCQVWVCAANGWHIYVSHGVVVGRYRYPPSGSKRWLALLP